jgi:hypothetical protein
MSYVVLSARCLLGTVFLVSAFTKLRSGSAFDEFTRTVRQLGKVPVGLVKPVARGVTLAEASIPFLLAVPAGLMTGVGFGLAILLLGTFAVAIVATLRRGTSVPCRCFGATTTPLGPRHVLRNAMLGAAAAAGLVGLFDGAPHAVTTGGAFVTAVAGVLAAVAVVMLDDLVDLVADAEVT